MRSDVLDRLTAAVGASLIVVERKQLADANPVRSDRRGVMLAFTNGQL